MIFNKTRKRKIASKKDFCDSIPSKAFGLMFSPKIKDKGLIFVFDKEEVRELHMFFVFFPIDVLFLDKNKKVVEIKENFTPFTLYFPKKKAQYVIELEKGTVKKTKTKTGDILRW